MGLFIVHLIIQFILMKERFIPVITFLFILLAGNFDKPETPLKSVPARLEPFYTGSNYKTRTETEFKYLIDDLHIMRRKSWGRLSFPSPFIWRTGQCFACNSNHLSAVADVN